ncbi:MAG: hypothetical protein IPF58_02085 [Saprospirales bacterium]|nr:hypothetical protein [Saprospirales bacterium]
MKKFGLLYAFLLLLVCISFSQNAINKTTLNCSGKYTISQFKSATSITDLCSDLLNYNVKSYVVYYQTKLSDGRNNLNIGVAFTENTKYFINKAKAGDVYYFDEITILMPDKSQKKYQGIAILIVN